MFKEMRRKDRKLESAEVEALLRKGEYGVLSTTTAEGYAYGVPLSYIYNENRVYFHCAMEGYKLENIKNNDRVSFCVIGVTEVLPEKFSTNYESVVLFGKARAVEGEEKEKALMGIIEKYSSNYIPEGKEYIKRAAEKTKVISIDIEHSSGKARR